MFMLTLSEEQRCTIVEVDTGFPEGLRNKKPVVEVREDKETTMSDMGRYYQEYLGKDSGGGYYSEGEYTVLKMVGAYHKSEKAFVGGMNVYVKVGVLHIKSCEPHAFF